MTPNNTKPTRPTRAEIPQSKHAASVAADMGTTIAIADPAIATASPSSYVPRINESSASRSATPRSAALRNRKFPSAEPLEKFRATGVMTWDKAEHYEWDAILHVGQFGLLSSRQLADWVFKDLATPAARHRQAQALTLRLCPQARARSNSQRLATAGHRPVLQALGRMKVGKQFFYYLNSRGLRFVQENYRLALPDAAKSTTTSADMLKRALAFQHCLALYRTNPDLTFVGRAALPADVSRHQGLDPLARAFLACLSNLWCAVSTGGKWTYTYVADNPGSSNGANVAQYRELARASSLKLGRTISIEVIGRRIPGEEDIALPDTQLARAVVKASARDVFWTEDGQYRIERLVAFFASLKPHAADISDLMERHRA